MCITEHEYTLTLFKLPACKEYSHVEKLLVLLVCQRYSKPTAAYLYLNEYYYAYQAPLSGNMIVIENSSC